MSKILEYILWSNCTNNCKFCLQCEKKDLATLLSPEEMCKSINTIEKSIDANTSEGDDILIVGGEILFPYNTKASDRLMKLIDHIINKIQTKQIRYLYLNTNLLYTSIANIQPHEYARIKDISEINVLSLSAEENQAVKENNKNRILLDYLLSRFVKSGLEQHLKFTTSYDPYGRFKSFIHEYIFFNNLKYIKDTYPTINIVVNSIMTKQLVEEYLSGNLDLNMFYDVYNVKYVSFIPYIPSSLHPEMLITFKDIVKVLEKREQEQPGFINFFINDLDLNQNRTLYQFTKDKGLVPCTASYSECHHNSNFKRVLPTQECFICKLKEIFR